MQSLQRLEDICYQQKIRIGEFSVWTLFPNLRTNFGLCNWDTGGFSIVPKLEELGLLRVCNLVVLSIGFKIVLDSGVGFVFTKGFVEKFWKIVWLGGILLLFIGRSCSGRSVNGIFFPVCLFWRGGSKWGLTKLSTVVE